MFGVAVNMLLAMPASPVGVPNFKIKNCKKNMSVHSGFTFAVCWLAAIEIQLWRLTFKLHMSLFTVNIRLYFLGSQTCVWPIAWVPSPLPWKALACRFNSSYSALRLSRVLLTFLDSQSSFTELACVPWRQATQTLSSVLEVSSCHGS